MDLFSLTCTTCKSRLKVRDPAVIGQILACPKCGGMVMVKPPEGWQPGMAMHAPPPSMTPGNTAVIERRDPDETHSESHFDAVDELLSDAPPKVKQPSVAVASETPALTKPRFVGAPLQASPRSNGAAAAVADPPPAAEAKQSPGVATDDDDAPDFAPARPRSYWMLLAGSVAGGIALAVAVVLAINAWRGDANATAVVVGLPSNSSPQVDPSQSPLTSTPTTPGNSTPPAGSPLVPPGPAPANPVSPPHPVDPAPPAVDPQPPIDPVPPPIPMPPLGDPLLDRILAPDSDPLAPPPIASSAKPPLPPEPDPADAPPPEKPTLPRPAARTVDVAARLADPLPGIETDGTPLADFLQVLSDLSTIPITLEPDALPLLQMGPEMSVVIKLTNTTVEGALNAGIRPRLEALPADGQLIVRLVEPDPLRSQIHAIKDLTGGNAEEAADLAELMQAVIEPAAWGAGAVEVAPDTLKISQRSAVHVQLFMLAEKLRTARGLPNSPRWRSTPELFKLDTRSQLAAEKLATPITANFSQPTKFGRILQHLEQAGGVRILVDWRDVAAAGWNPDGEATLAVEKQPLAAALTALVEPMDLAWRIVDSRTLQVVRPETLHSRGELELYHVPALLKNDPAGETLMSLLRTTLGEEQFRSGGGPGEIRCDAAGQCLLVWLPQPRQQEMAGLLAKWASAAAAE